MENIVRQDYNIQRKHRNEHKKHASFVVWFTGLSGSGKSTIANEVERALFERGLHTYSLDGDNIRGGLNKDLGFCHIGRNENLRRIAEVAKLFSDAGIITLAAFISPLEEDRKLVREIIGDDQFVEVFVDTSIEVCQERDVKGLYKKARAGEIENFTGISAPYDAPIKPDIHIKTEEDTLENAVEKILAFLNQKLSK